jgi:hypothetical protein
MFCEETLFVRSTVCLSSHAVKQLVTVGSRGSEHAKKNDPKKFLLHFWNICKAVSSLTMGVLNQAVPVAESVRHGSRASLPLLRECLSQVNDASLFSHCPFSMVQRSDGAFSFSLSNWMVVSPTPQISQGTEFRRTSRPLESEEKAVSLDVETTTSRRGSFSQTPQFYRIQNDAKFYRTIAIKLPACLVA